MNWLAIKQIYYRDIVHNDKIEYLGEDRYKLISLYRTGEKHWESEYKNGQLCGKDIVWWINGQKNYGKEYQNGKRIK